MKKRFNRIAFILSAVAIIIAGTSCKKETIEPIRAEVPEEVIETPEVIDDKGTTEKVSFTLHQSGTDDPIITVLGGGLLEYEASMKGLSIYRLSKGVYILHTEKSYEYESITYVGVGSNNLSNRIDLVKADRNKFYLNVYDLNINVSDNILNGSVIFSISGIVE